MLFERQKSLLALVDALGGNLSSLDFQKLLLLYCREVEPTPSYGYLNLGKRPQGIIMPSFGDAPVARAKGKGCQTVTDG